MANDHFETVTRVTTTTPAPKADLDAIYARVARRRELLQLTEAYVVGWGQGAMTRAGIIKALELATYTLSKVDEQLDEEFDVED